MSRDSIAAAIPVGDRVLLDTTSLIAYFNGNEQVSPICAHIIDGWIMGGRNEAIVSMVTVMEIMIRPLRRNPGVYQHVLDFLRNFPNVRPLVIDLAVAQEAASQRASYNFSPPDALIVGSGLVAQVGHLVTNDAAWKTKLKPVSARVKVCYLGDHLPFG